MKERIISYTSGLAEFQRLMFEKGRLYREIAYRCLKKKEEMMEMLGELSSDEEYFDLLRACPDQRSYEILASAMGEVIGPARVLEIEADSY